MTNPKGRQKRVKNVTSELNKKKQHLFPHASRSLLCIRFVAVAFQSEEEVFFKKGSPKTYFCPALDPIWQNALKHVRHLEYLIHTKFHQNTSSGSVAKADYVFQYIYMR